MGLVLSAFYWVSRINAGRENSVTTLIKPTAQEADIALLENSGELVAQFDAIERVRETTPKDAKLLEQAVSYQEEYYAHSSNFTDMEDARALKKRWHDVAAKPLNERAKKLAGEADELVELKDYERAKDLMDEASALMRTVNQTYDLSRYCNVGLEVRYGRRVRELEALPRYEKSLKLEEGSRLAAEQGDWGSAHKQIVEATELQDSLVKEFSGITVADSTRLRRLQREVASYDSLEDFQKSQAFIKQGETLERAGKFEYAAELFEQARAVQSTLNHDYPSSRFASAEAVDALGRRAQTALSREDATVVLALLGELDREIVERHALQVRAKADALLPKLDTFRRKFPRSEALPSDTFERVNFLVSVGADIPAIDSKLSRAVKKLPSGGAIYLMPVEQAFFRQINASNPSRVNEPGKPVESVNLADCDNFCRHLSWLLRKDVRLPTPSELKGMTLDMGEWVRDTDGELGVFANGRFMRKSLSDRSRTVTFRFVIEEAVR